MKAITTTIILLSHLTANMPAHVHVYANRSQPATVQTERQWLMQTIDSVASEHQVPAKVMKAIAWNESRYRWVVGSYGDLGYFQIIPSTYNHLAHYVALSGNEREDNVRVAAYYLRHLHDKYGSWYKARFAYGRGHWRDSSTWTCMEKEFMRNFDKYLNE